MKSVKATHESPKGFCKVHTQRVIKTLYSWWNQAGELEDRRAGERFLWGGEEAGGEGGGEQPKSRNVDRTPSSGNVDGETADIQPPSLVHHQYTHAVHTYRRFMFSMSNVWLLFLYLCSDKVVTRSYCTFLFAVRFGQNYHIFGWSPIGFRF